MVRSTSSTGLLSFLPYLSHSKPIRNVPDVRASWTFPVSFENLNGFHVGFLTGISAIPKGLSCTPPSHTHTLLPTPPFLLFYCIVTDRQSVEIAF